MEPKHIATKPHLLTLAQELQDKIFSFAYPNTKILGRKQWDDLEWQRYCAAKWGTFRTPRRFQHNIVNDLMVSKQYFVSAGYTYVSKLVFELVADVPADVRQEGGIIYHWRNRAAVRSRRMAHRDETEPDRGLLYPGSTVRFASSELRKINMTCDMDYGLYKLLRNGSFLAFDSWRTVLFRLRVAGDARVDFEAKADGPNSFYGRLKSMDDCVDGSIERLSLQESKADDRTLADKCAMRRQQAMDARHLIPSKCLWLVVIELVWLFWLQ
ncbi:hypothetical protein LTR56_011350 [Elasticomyces elasticus]|nr:hypothetical protein LTR56_011350 [Elasticomyces elasticus]KAK3660952.1 hypothetical protein LTR22_007780 [Elasticomyces elasticus]KAK4932359.1 hypothetical protein LTR49_001228 [Elasticomyces elasticus]KAK5768367.1 hypothetical protein LTS12_001506 [Elasticomyces elasticus]